MRKAVLSFFILLLLAGDLPAQDEPEDNGFVLTRSFFVGIHGTVVKDMGQQANFFRGYNQVFGLSDLLAIPQVQSELYNRTNQYYSLRSYPDPMRYNVTVGPGVDLLYDAGDVNFVLSATTCKLSTSGIFTLGATNPANPNGDELIKTETIEGQERRTWLKAAVQFKNEIDQRSDFFIELAPMLYFQKALRNTVSIEGINYSILVNPANVPVRTSYMGYGLGAGLGYQAVFKGNKFLQFAVNASLSKLKMVDSQKLNPLLEACLSVYL